MNSVGRVNLRDIARKNNVSVSTVSRALRNHSGIPPKTRERIRTSAEGMGYRPNPLIGALMANVRARKSASIANLACLYKEEIDQSFQISLKQFLSGVEEGASQLGYHVSHFKLNELETKPATIHRIWKARNIRGVVLYNFRPKREYPLPWNQYAWVVCGGTTEAPTLARVGNEIYQIVKVAVKQSVARGYRKPALVVPLTGTSRHGFRWVGAFIANAMRYVKSKTDLPVYHGEWNQRSFLKWLKSEKPDVVLAMSDDVHDWLRHGGYKIPEKIGFLHLIANSSNLNSSGVLQDFIQTGVKAIACLDSQLRNNEIGVPSLATTMTLSGIWQEGSTLRRSKHI